MLLVGGGKSYKGLFWVDGGGGGEVEGWAVEIELDGKMMKEQQIVARSINVHKSTSLTYFYM